MTGRRCGLACVLPLFILWGTVCGEEPEKKETVFSGPQVGEKLVPFVARSVSGENAGQDFNLVEEAQGSPLLLIFIHEVTRPSIGLTRLAGDYAAKRHEDGLRAGVILLTDDATESEAWARRAHQALPQEIPVGISPDGLEGPGAYGLNRNVALTVLVAKDNQVTANFALVQPSVQADLPQIAKAVVDVLGGGEVPTLEELMQGADERAMQREEADLRELVRPLIQKDATSEEVLAAAEKILAAMEKNKRLQARIGRIAQTIVRSGKLEDYGTPAAQVYLRDWAEKYGPADK
jgi:hypothetical protein